MIVHPLILPHQEETQVLLLQRHYLVTQQLYSHLLVQTQQPKLLIILILLQVFLALFLKPFVQHDDAYDGVYSKY